MPKLEMLRKTDEFSSVFSFKKRFSKHFLVIHYKPSITATRIGFVVAKKIAKLAVDRNYMRRVLREVCRQELQVLSKVDVIIQVQKPFKNADFLTIKQELNILFAKIHKNLATE